MEKETKSKVKIKKPSPLIFWPVCLLVRPFAYLRYGLRIDKSGLKGLEGPALVLCPHISNIDFVVVALTLFPLRPTFVVSEHFMARPLLRRLLTLMHVIPKKMFCPDVRTIMSVLRARDSGNVVVLFPEGRLTSFGHSLQVTEGTAELVKKMGVPVYVVTGNGAYKTLPKWSQSGLRRGRIEVTTAKLFDAEDIKVLSAAQINEGIEEAILHDEDSVLTDIAYKSTAPARGLANALYQCPVCRAEFTTEDGDRNISCRACGFSAELDERYRLRGGPFETINEWYFWQEAQIDLDTPLESEAVVAAADKEGNIDWDAGEGLLRMDRETISFSGSCFGEELSFSEKTSDIKALPVSLGHHFDLYHKRVMYNFILKPSPRQVIKWSMYMDKLEKER